MPYGFLHPLQEEKYAHSYAYDWRTKLPTIYRATDQWFASIDGFRCACAHLTRQPTCNMHAEALLLADPFLYGLMLHVTSLFTRELQHMPQTYAAAHASNIQVHFHAFSLFKAATTEPYGGQPRVQEVLLLWNRWWHIDSTPEASADKEYGHTVQAGGAGGDRGGAVAAGQREEAHHRHDAGPLRLVHQPPAQVGRPHPRLLRQGHRSACLARSSLLLHASRCPAMVGQG